MAIGKFQTLDTRHEQKMTPMGEKPRPGDERDCKLLLSYQGQQNAYKTGQNPDVVPHGFDIIVVDHSTNIRTKLTAQHMLAGAGYNPHNLDEVSWRKADPRIGLANGMDFAHADLEPFGPENPQADNYAKSLLTRTWEPVEGGEETSRPVAAKLAYALIDNRISAIEKYAADVAEGASIFHLQCSHGPFIDSLDAALFQLVQVKDGKTLLNEERWPGHYAMGTFISGRMNDLGTKDNPRFNFTGQPFKNRKPRMTKYSLDDLKRLRENLHNTIEGKF